MQFKIFQGDCVDVMRSMPDNSVDSIVTDPPYGLGFMGHHWDHGVPSVEVWRECLRVLKPGGHLLAFAGTRTQHRMAVNIEDAGFEIRDLIAWVYSTGFPKSMNLDRQKGEVFCGCEEGISREPKTKCNVHPVRNTNVSSSVDSCEGGGEILQSGVPEQGPPKQRQSHSARVNEGCKQPCVEGWSDVSASARKLCSSTVCESPDVGTDHGTQGRLCDGAQVNHGEDGRTNLTSTGGSTSLGSRPTQQRSEQPRVVAGQQGTQTRGAWSVCDRCGKSRVPSGLGTALKPALEPITVARKPLAEKTVATNVLTHGTGAINIDGCRVGDSKNVPASASKSPNNIYGAGMTSLTGGTESSGFDPNIGRWPANLMHDGSEEVVALFPDSNGAGPSLPRVKITGYGDGAVGTGKSEYFGGERIPFNSGSGSAARFFYCAKASRSEREYGLEGLTDQVLARPTQAQAEAERGNTVDQASGGFNTAKVRKNHHPTVKPVALMRYLARLVTPPGGTMLDMYCGSGSGLVGGILEGFNVIGIDLDRDDKGNPLGYIDIANARALRAQVEAFDAEMDGSEL